MKRATRHVSADLASPTIFAKSYKYDALGRLRSDTVEDLTGASDGDATVYNHDGQNIARTYVIAGDGVVRDYRFYTHSNNTDELLGLALADPNQSATTAARNRDPEPGVGYYAHTDHQGSIRAITDDTGAVVNEYTYGAYGNTETAVESIPQRFRYTGREWDNDIALMHYRARVYDPDSGRFLQEDPIGLVAMHPSKSDVFAGEFPEGKVEQGFAVAFASEHNPYRYVSNNPNNYRDPSGTSAFSYAKLNMTIAVVVAKKGIPRLVGAKAALVKQTLVKMREPIKRGAAKAVVASLKTAECLAVIADTALPKTGADSIETLHLGELGKRACAIAGWALGGWLSGK